MFEQGLEIFFTYENHIKLRKCRSPMLKNAATSTSENRKTRGMFYICILEKRSKIYKNSHGRSISDIFEITIPVGCDFKFIRAEQFLSWFVAIKCQLLWWMQLVNIGIDLYLSTSLLMSFEFPILIMFMQTLQNWIKNSTI